MDSRPQTNSSVITQSLTAQSLQINSSRNAWIECEINMYNYFPTEFLHVVVMGNRG